MMRCVAEIGLLAYPDCQLSSIHGLTDLFRIATEWTAETGRSFIRVTHWQRDAHSPDGSLVCTWDSHPGAMHRLDYIILPPSIVMPEQMAEMAQEAAWLKDQHSSGTRIGSVCAGAFVLAASGLLDGRRVTTHWAFAGQLADCFPDIDVADQHMILDDGDIITAGGILAWTDLGLTLVERLMGPSVMLATARFLLIDPPRNSQRPFAQFLPPFGHGDDAILRVQHHIHARPADAHSLIELSGIAGLGERTFLRRFSAATGFKPTGYIQNVRIAKAREGLELTRRTVDEIAWEVGYEDSSAFRKVFRKLIGTTPNAYRIRFGVKV
ncbi:GlxA family transcriptional regulator [uncultured Roseibium sp.]|uniref:GlxA family transcriptional regulator n=1 Tax=uncultured Roseibium sp. TaxID=1936171 RepID=UPI0026373692|nr:GlxA family transcriptional regulator [uncultured Roseibium sp.]